MQYNPAEFEGQHDFSTTLFGFHAASTLTDDLKCAEVCLVTFDKKTNQGRDTDEERFFDPRDSEDRAILHALLDKILDEISALKSGK